MRKNYIGILVLICFMVSSCDFFNSEKEKENTPSETKATETKDTPKEDKKAKEIVIENTKPAFGIDISSYQGNEMAALEKDRDSIDFIICKATQGTTFIDPRFKQNWTTIKEKGFIRGAYHYYNSQDNPLHQAEFFINTIKDIQPTDLPPVIDIEGGSVERGQSIDEIQLSLLTLLKEIESRLLVTPIIYTNAEFANEYLNNPEFANFPLWIADYESTDTPILPNTWKEKGYVLWQKSDTYKILNYTNDEDYFNGDLEALKAFIKNSRK